MIPEGFISSLLERADIVDVIGRYVTLKKSGRNFMACCPFHKEKTPSFSVSPSKQIFKCFGCGKAGNAIGFLMDIEHLEFPEAVRRLADIYGMQVPEDNSPHRQDASTYQAVSGAGAGGPVELMGEVEALLKGESYQPKVFSHQIAFNLIPQIGGEQFEGYTSEEMKMQNEGRKIMHLPELKVSCTCVRVPVVRSHSISVSLHFDRPVTVAQAREAIANAPGCRLVDDLSNKQYPMPLDTSDQDIVFVGRIRPDLTDPNGLCLWCCGDQVRKGAATNAIQIAELLVK